MTADLVAAGALILCPIVAGIAAGVILDAASHMLAIRRTGHERDCPAPAWSCSCRDS